MVKVNLVTGQVDSEKLGRTLIHEHLVLRSDEVVAQFPHVYDEEQIFKNAVESLNEVKKRGIDTVCDPTVSGMGRDVRFMKRVSEETGVQVICATGIYSFNEIPAYFQNRDVDHMADLFVRDIEVGIQNTSIKAGFLKCAADEKGITLDLDKVFRATARAQKRTGVPIMTHSHPASENGIKQMKIFEEEGVNSKAILIGHTGDTTDMEYIHKVLDKGVFIGMDRYGQGPLASDKRNETLIELAKEGYSDRMFLSQDYCCSIDWFPEGHNFWKDNPKWSMTFLLDEVIPNLKSAGVTEKQIDAMMVENVSRWFDGAAN